MLSFDSFIVKEGDTFYFDLEDYNSKSDINIEYGDIIRFKYDGIKYTGKVDVIGSKKNQSFIINDIKNIDIK
jgi:hypothetical protein